MLTAFLWGLIAGGWWVVLHAQLSLSLVLGMGGLSFFVSLLSRARRGPELDVLYACVGCALNLTLALN